MKDILLLQNFYAHLVSLRQNSLHMHFFPCFELLKIKSLSEHAL